MDVTAHREGPPKNQVMSKEENEKLLLRGVVDEGSAVIDTTLQVGISIIEREDGALACLDTQFNRAVSRDGGRTWADYSAVEDLGQRRKAVEDGSGMGGFGWIKFPSGKLGMGWNEDGRDSKGHRYNRLWWRTSDDEGRSWSDDVLINPTGELGCPYLGEPIRLTSGGRLLLPVRSCFSCGEAARKMCPTGMAWWKGQKGTLEVEGHYPQMEIAYVYYSDDEGMSWSRCDGDVFGWLYRGWGNCVACDEPAVEELKDGRLMLLMRSTVGRLLQSFSEDAGEQWSLVEPSPLASSHSPCALKKIPETGDLMCVWNQVSADEIRQGKWRARLSAAITTDGKSWSHFRTLERHGRTDEADRIEPDDQLILCRSLDDVGDIPPDVGASSYPTAAFHGEDVIVSYPHCKAGAEWTSPMKICVLPLDWFYEAP